jgi:predicted nucleotidyltransferase component of viral defense system
VFERVLAQSAQSLLARLSEVELVRSFYLAGGTGLALQLGHRCSEDLDWFSQTDFNSAALAAELAAIAPTQITDQDSGTLAAVVGGIEVGFYRYPYPLLFPAESYRGLTVASWKDILCMKLVAIGQRAAKRDFVDIYCGLKAGLTLRQLLDLMKCKYGDVEYSEYHLVRSLTYFDEVEAEPLPSLLHEVSWDEIRSVLLDEVRKLGDR